MVQIHSVHSISIRMGRILRYPNQKVVKTTTAANLTISEHFYRALRLVFEGTAATTMDGHSDDSHGIEFFNQSLLVYNPKWAYTLHGLKMGEFYSYFRAQAESAHDYSTKFQKWMTQLDYNDMMRSETKFSRQFISALGLDFTNIRNNPNPDPG